MLDCSRGCAFPTDMVGVVSNTVKLCKSPELEDMIISEHWQALSSVIYPVASFLQTIGLINFFHI